MPIYEYQCGACGERLEVMQKISEDPLRECPHCREEALRKLVSAVAFRLKGSGWYETDFKDKKARKNAGREEAGGDKAEAGTEKTETAPTESSSGKAGSGASDSRSKDTTNTTKGTPKAEGSTAG